MATSAAKAKVKEDPKIKDKPKPTKIQDQILKDLRRWRAMIQRLCALGFCATWAGYTLAHDMTTITVMCVVGMVVVWE